MEPLREHGISMDDIYYREYPKQMGFVKCVSRGWGVVAELLYNRIYIEYRDTETLGLFLGKSKSEPGGVLAPTEYLRQ